MKQVNCKTDGWGQKRGGKSMGNMPAGSKAFIWKQRGSLGAVEFGSIHDGGYKDIRGCRADDPADRIGYVISGGVCFELCDRQNP